MVQVNTIPDGWRKLEQPNKRLELVSLLSELADKEAQERLWIRHEDYPNSSGIDEIFHFIFDDTDIGDEPKSLIGIVFLNEQEAYELETLSALLSRMLNRLGNMSSEYYMRDDEWPLVMSQAMSALQRLQDDSHS